MLSAAQADALRAELAGVLGIRRNIGVGPHAQSAHFIRPLEQFDEIGFLLEIRIGRGDLTGEHLTGAAIDRDEVALLDRLAIGDEQLLLDIHADRFRARHARLAQTTRDHGGMRGRAAALRQNTFGDEHTVHVIRIGFLADQNHGLASLAPLFGGVRIEGGDTGGGARRGIQTLRQENAGLLGLLVKARQQQQIDLHRV